MVDKKRGRPKKAKEVEIVSKTVKLKGLSKEQQEHLKTEIDREEVKQIESLMDKPDYFNEVGHDKSMLNLEKQRANLTKSDSETVIKNEQRRAMEFAEIITKGKECKHQVKQQMFIPIEMYLNVNVINSKVVKRDLNLYSIITIKKEDAASSGLTFYIVKTTGEDILITEKSYKDIISR